MKNSTTFYIVRHAVSEANKAQRISGQSETDLSPEGIEQAKNRAQELKDIQFDAAFSSDLSRAQQTATLLAAQNNLTVTAKKILRERHYGEVEGKRYHELEQTLKKQFDDYNALSDKERFLAKLVPGMESDEEVVGRCLTFLRETALAYPGKTVLVVTHGNLMRTLLVHLGFGTHQELPHGTVKNTGYFVLKSDGVEFELGKMVGIEKKQV